MTEPNVKEVLKAATGAHGIFKAQLFEAIEKGNLSEFASAKPGRDDLCTFGKWLHNGVPPALRTSPHYPIVLSLHAAFHKAVAKAVVLAERGKKTEAVESVQQAATPLTLELMAWARETESHLD